MAFNSPWHPEGMEEGGIGGRREVGSVGRSVGGGGKAYSGGPGSQGEREEGREGGGSEGGLERVLRIAGGSGAAVLCLSECGVGAGVEHLIAIGTPHCCNGEG